MSDNINQDRINAIVADAAAARAPYSRFTPEESVFLCRAFVNVSQDPITGADQKSAVFWSKVHVKFMRLCEGTPGAGHLKTAKSLQTKWKKSVMPKVNHYLGVARTNPMASGENDGDYHTRLCEIFNRRHGKPFNFSSCLEVLKQMPKFEMFLRDDESTLDHSKINGSVYSSVKTPRPMGNKVAKRIQAESAKTEETAVKKAKALESLAESGRLLALTLQSDNYTTLAAIYAEKGNKQQSDAFLLKAVALAAGIVPGAFRDDDRTTTVDKENPEKETPESNNENAENNVPPAAAMPTTAPTALRDTAIPLAATAPPTSRNTGVPRRIIVTEGRDSVTALNSEIDDDSETMDPDLSVQNRGGTQL
jgi:hypothetical protein